MASEKDTGSSRLTSVLMNALFATGIGYVGAAYFASRWLTRSKHRKPDRDPGELDISFESINCRTQDGLRLVGWSVEPRVARGTVAMFHGLRCTRALFLERMAILVKAGYRCVVFDHRAHGESQGRLTSFGYHESRDVAAVLHYVRQRWPESPRIAHGISMGAAAICFAAKHACAVDAIVLESLYHDIKAAFTTRINAGFPGWYGRLMHGIIWITEKRLGLKMEDVTPADHIGCLAPAPVLLITGTEDSHASPLDASRLYERCEGPRELVLVPGAGHCDLLEVAGTAYEEHVLGFLERWVPAPLAV
jgi:pimeloyl-ACP methyl ester carboxylesterase